MGQLIDNVPSAYGIHLSDLFSPSVADVEKKLLDPLADLPLVLIDVRNTNFAALAQELLANDPSELAFCDPH